MPNAQRTIRHHAISDNQHLTSRLITIQTLGQGIEPFISLEISKAGGVATANDFLMSPDSGTAIITFLLAGEAEYIDSTHKQVSLKKNDVIWTLSGSGIRYLLQPKTQDCVSVKLRVALSPALEGYPAQSIYLESNLIERDGPAQLLLGHYGNAQGGFALPALINYLFVTLTAGQKWVYETPVNHNVAWAACISGKIKTSNRLLSSQEIAVYENSNKPITFFAEDDCIFLLGSSIAYGHDRAFGKYLTQTTHDLA